MEDFAPPSDPQDDYSYGAPVPSGFGQDHGLEPGFYSDHPETPNFGLPMGAPTRTAAIKAMVLQGQDHKLRESQWLDDYATSMISKHIDESRSREAQIQAQIDRAMGVLNRPVEAAPTRTQFDWTDAVATGLAGLFGAPIDRTLNQVKGLADQRAQIDYHNRTAQQQHDYGLAQYQLQSGARDLDQEQQYRRGLESDELHHAWTMAQVDRQYQHQDAKDALAAFDHADTEADVDQAVQRLKQLAARTGDDSLVPTDDVVKSKHESVKKAQVEKGAKNRLTAVDFWNRELDRITKTTGAIREEDIPSLLAQRKALADAFLDGNEDVLQVPRTVESMKAKELEAKYTRMTPAQKATAAYHEANLEIARERVAQAAANAAETHDYHAAQLVQNARIHLRTSYDNAERNAVAQVNELNRQIGDLRKSVVPDQGAIDKLNKQKGDLERYVNEIRKTRESDPLMQDAEGSQSGQTQTSASPGATMLPDGTSIQLPGLTGAIGKGGTKPVTLQPPGMPSAAQMRNVRRQQAMEAIKQGKDPNAVRKKFKELTGEDL